MRRGKKYQFGSYCCHKHYGRNQLKGERGYLALCILITIHSKQKLKQAGTRKQELKQRPRKSAAGCDVLHDFLSLISYMA